MAKQTFTTGQVLTAAQMTSLQQTAMGGGSTTAKTASYTLVAADAGTVIQMNSASATTITVNTALFAAGDTVQIQNIGAGVCTVTAGTATVNTAGSLALSQYEGGSLYFNTTSAALFFDYVQAGGAASFNTSLATVATDQTTTSTSYVDLATAGPAVTVTTGTKALVSIKASMANGAASTGQLMGVAVSGATTLAASDTYAAGYKYIATVNFQPVFAATFLIEGLTAGSNTFTAKYRSATGDTVYFKERMISVVNLGS
jgi:hypothetical protein